MQNKSRKWFTVSGRSKQASKHTHARVQWIHASVGLAQARPNKLLSYWLKNDDKKGFRVLDDPS